jgi:hypothetical protein
LKACGARTLFFAQNRKSLIALRPEWREEVEDFTNEVSAGSDDGERDEELAEVELLRQNFLDVFLTVNRKASICHHEMDPCSKSCVILL